MNLFDLSNKVAIVTGASRGIGRSIAFQLARAGAKVVVSSRKLDACETVVKEIQAEGGSAMAISASIAIKSQLEEMVQKTRDAWGSIDVLVCNAASNPYYGPMTGMSDEVFNKIMHNNVLSSSWLCNMVYPDMKAKKNGAIVLISSVGGLHGSHVIGPYNISKAADMQLARNLAVEWGPDNIRVNCIAPGLIRTDFAKALTDDPVKAGMVENETPLRRIGDPDDIGGIAVLLASAAGKYITPSQKTGAVLFCKVRFRLSVIGFSERPVHQFVQECFNKLRAHVAVINVVSMFPNVHGQQSFVGGSQGCASSAHVDDVNRAVGFLNQPSPARTKIANSAFDEGFFEGRIGAKLGIDGSSQCTCGLTTTVRLHAVPEKCVVPNLSGVVVNTTAGFLDNFFQRHRFKLGAFLQVVQIDDIRVVVLAVVKLQSFFAVIWCQSINGVRQCGQGMFHLVLVKVQ